MKRSWRAEPDGPLTGQGAAKRKKKLLSVMFSMNLHVMVTK
jgi:hypothetical protein